MNTDHLMLALLALFLAAACGSVYLAMLACDAVTRAAFVYR